ncbi:hypothetical protein VULLAG_LOCUS15360 [Vulpes lagopus]
MKKGSGGRITSLTLEKKGDGKEGGRGRGWLGDATGNAAAPAAAGSGGLAAGARRAGGRRSRESVRGGRWRRRRRLLVSLRQEQLQAAAGSSGHGGGGGGGSSLQTPGSGSSTAPHTPGTWEPGNRFRPRGPPPPSAAPARPPSRPSPLLGARSGSVRALPPARSPVSGCGAGSSSLPSFLPLSLGPGGGGGGGGGTSLHSPGSGAALCEERRLRSRLALPHSPSPSYSSSASFLPHPAFHRPAPRHPRNRRLGIAGRGPRPPASATEPRPEAQPITDVGGLRLLPEKADRPEEPITKCRRKSTPKGRKVPKAAEREEGRGSSRGWPAGESDNGSGGQSQPPALTERLEELRTAKPGVTGEAARLGAPAAFVIGRKLRWECTCFGDWRGDGGFRRQSGQSGRLLPRRGGEKKKEKGGRLQSAFSLARSFGAGVGAKGKRREAEARSGSQSALRAVQSQDLAAL